MRASRGPTGLALIALIALIAAAPALAELPPSGSPAGGLQLSVDPAHLVLGQEGEVRLSIVSDRGELSPDAVTLYASAGQLDAPQLDDAGQLVARYQLPAELYPQVAILAAVVQGAGTPQVGWISVPLHGQGELTLDGRPGKPISIQIGEQSFGPVKARRDGTATVKVEVAPGYAVGRVGTTEIPLGVVAFSRILLVPQGPSVEAGNQNATALHVFAVDERGAGLEGAVIELQSDTGELGELQELSPGAYSAELRAGELAVGDAVRVVARLAEATQFESQAELQVIAAAPVAPAAEQPVPVASTTSDWPWIMAGTAGGVFAVSGVVALALESTLSLSSAGSAEDRETMQGMERAMLGVATAGLVVAAVGGGIALAGDSE